MPAARCRRRRRRLVSEARLLAAIGNWQRQQQQPKKQQQQMRRQRLWPRLKGRALDKHRSLARTAGHRDNWPTGPGLN